VDGLSDSTDSSVLPVCKYHVQNIRKGCPSGGHNLQIKPFKEKKYGKKTLNQIKKKLSL
jgi:hypothetical protein